MLSEVAGLPGAPARISQAAATYRQGPGNSVSIGLAGPASAAAPPVFRVLLPVQVTGPPMTTSELAGQVRSSAGPGIVASVTRRRSRRIPGAARGHDRAAAGGPRGAAVPAPLAAAPAAARGTGCRGARPVPGCSRPWRWRDRARPGLAPGSPGYAAAQRFAALPAAVRHAWLARHLAALRAGRISLAQLP